MPVLVQTMLDFRPLPVGCKIASSKGAAHPAPAAAAAVAVDVTLPTPGPKPLPVDPRATWRRAYSAPARQPVPHAAAPAVARCAFTWAGADAVTAPALPSVSPPGSPAPPYRLPSPSPQSTEVSRSSAPAGADERRARSVAPARPVPEALPLRNQLGFLSQRIKPVLGNVSRRGMQYGIVVGLVMTGLLSVAAPIVGPFFAVAGAALAAAVPVVLVACVLGGAVIEVFARRRRVPEVSLEDVRQLEAIYTLLQQRRRDEGKLSLEDREAWHKVNRMLEEMSGGFWRGVRLILASQFRMRMHCGRYRVGDIFAETRAPEKAG